MRARADSPTKHCTRADCERPLRARGLCSTHYNQEHQPDRHAPKPTACAVCSRPIQRSPNSDRTPACSTDCRRALQVGADAPRTNKYRWSITAAHRARNAGARVIDYFERHEVFERDAYTCYLCGRHVDQDASPFDPTSPTVDHVIPLSRGGDHTLANARTACLGCNSAKQDHPPIVTRCD